MANRILLGKRGSDYGLWVSKPGSNVATCDAEDMLFDSANMDYGQVLARGMVAGDAGATNISVTVRDGIKPLVISRGYDSGNTTMSTRRSAASSTQSYLSAGGSNHTVSISVSTNTATVTITPEPNLEPDIAYIILQGSN